MRLTTVAAALILLLSACAAPEESALDSDVLTIGIRVDLPLVGEDAGDGVEGFEVDVAVAVAEYLGKDYEFVPVDLTERRTFLLQGKVDMSVATYSITPDRKQEVLFAGPYAIEYFDILVRAGDDSISSVSDLEGKTVCGTKGSSVFQRIRAEQRVPVTTIEVDEAPECMDYLADGRADALTTDIFILTGLRSTADFPVRIVGAPYSEERVGIGLRRDDVAACEEINRAITHLYTSGRMEEMLLRWFGRTGLDVEDMPVPQFEGCF
ncbi:transporter substrate-binding domain-containing protein [Salininema proteolyticum]|uniref:Transporter substrate-binding domain-containing protein n=1 Tax=Salininema proteolyticum TaxID=1607685 RepID=A0ABV8U0Y7_9ACTN